MGTNRRIYLRDSVPDFLQHLLTVNATTILLVVCSARDTFLEQIYEAIWNNAQETSKKHQLLTKSLGLLSSSSRVQLVFCPTLEHLRACLSVLPNFVKETPTNENQKSQRPLLAVLNILALHLSTSEFSAQGLSRTLAAAVEVSSRGGFDLLLCEGRHAPDDDGRERGEALWYVDVPLLNTSARTNGEVIPKGRSVPIKRIAERWFKFDENSHTVPETLQV